jgi:3D (Asp-Asp-Asp) domain-containing protein
MHNLKRFSLALVAVLAVTALGAGCFRVSPRVVKAPDRRQSVQVAGKTAAGSPHELGEQYETSSSSTALAYLQLNGGKADITRGGTKVAAVDGLELASGDRIVVTTGTVYVVYPEYGASELETGTDIVLSSDDSQPGLVMQLELVTGRVWTRFERLFGNGEYYAVSSNGVVATVRGTGFGVSVEDGVVDVQVADHEVEVTIEKGNSSDWRAGTIPQVLRLSAGEGLKIATRGALPDMRLLRQSIRRLNVTERLAEGFKFGASKLLPERLRRPVNPVRLKIQPIMTPELLRYRELMLRRAALFTQSSSTFVAPLRAPTLQETAPPTSSPTLNGPRG